MSDRENIEVVVKPKRALDGTFLPGNKEGLGCTGPGAHRISEDDRATLTRELRKARPEPVYRGLSIEQQSWQTAANALHAVDEKGHPNSNAIAAVRMVWEHLYGRPTQRIEGTLGMDVTFYKGYPENIPDARAIGGDTGEG